MEKPDDSTCDKCLACLECRGFGYEPLECLDHCVNGCCAFITWLIPYKGMNCCYLIMFICLWLILSFRLSFRLNQEYQVTLAADEGQSWQVMTPHTAIHRHWNIQTIASGNKEDGTSAGNSASLPLGLGLYQYPDGSCPSLDGPIKQVSYGPDILDMASCRQKTFLGGYSGTGDRWLYETFHANEGSTLNLHVHVIQGRAELYLAKLYYPLLPNPRPREEDIVQDLITRHCDQGEYCKLKPLVSYYQKRYSLKEGQTRDMIYTVPENNVYMLYYEGNAILEVSIQWNFTTHNILPNKNPICTAKDLARSGGCQFHSNQEPTTLRQKKPCFVLQVTGNDDDDDHHQQQQKQQKQQKQHHERRQEEPVVVTAKCGMSRHPVVV